MKKKIPSKTNFSKAFGRGAGSEAKLKMPVLQFLRRLPDHKIRFENLRLWFEVFHSVFNSLEKNFCSDLPHFESMLTYCGHGRIGNC